jgi:hypothetical protein
MFALLLFAAQAASPEVQVLGPGKPNAQTPATLMAEPAAMFVVACDAGGDGQVGRAELDACVARSFATADAAGTGSVGYLAFAGWQTRWLGDQGALPSPFEIDRDGDNRVTLAELQAQFARLFGRFDTDGDGQVTRAEALTIRASAIGGSRQKRGVPAGAQRVPGGTPEPDDAQP